MQFDHLQTYGSVEEERWSVLSFISSSGTTSIAVAAAQIVTKINQSRGQHFVMMLSHSERERENKKSRLTITNS